MLTAQGRHSCVILEGTCFLVGDAQGSCFPEASRLLCAPTEKAKRKMHHLKLHRAGWEDSSLEAPAFALLVK